MAERPARLRKYHLDNLIPMFLKAAVLRNEMIDAGFTDNGGAIHSATRILDILGLCLNYPELSHINNLRRFSKAEFSAKALQALKRGEEVKIEHVSPLREFTVAAINEILEATGKPEPDARSRLERFVREHYRLVLLTTDEAAALNRKNRSRMCPDRLAGIEMATKEAREQSPPQSN
jgi:hypothetical protein